MESVHPRHDKRADIMTENRMKKYIDRKFDIKLHPCYDEIDEFIKDELKLNEYNAINTINEGRHQNNIKYIDNGEINLSRYDY